MDSDRYVYAPHHSFPRSASRRVFSRVRRLASPCVPSPRALRRAPNSHCRFGGPKAIPRADRSKLARARRLRGQQNLHKPLTPSLAVESHTQRVTMALTRLLAAAAAAGLAAAQTSYAPATTSRLLGDGMALRRRRAESPRSRHQLLHPHARQLGTSWIALSRTGRERRRVLCRVRRGAGAASA